MPDSAQGQTPTQQIQVASGHGLTVQVAPKTIIMYYLTEEQLDTVASLNVLNNVCLAFLGITLGAWIAFYITLKTTEIKDPSTHAAFVAVTVASGCLALFFFIFLVVGLVRSMRALSRLKKTGTIGSVTPLAE